MNKLLRLSETESTFNKFRVHLQLCFIQTQWKNSLYKLFCYIHSGSDPLKIRSTCMKYNNIKLYEPPHDKTNKMECVPIEDQDQPGHPSSLIRVFAVCSMDSYGPKLSSCRQRRLIRLCGCPGWSESSLGVLAILLVLSWGGSYSEFLSSVGSWVITIMILNFRTAAQTQIRLKSVCIFWMHYSTVKSSFSNFRVITANFTGVRILRIFTVLHLCCRAVQKRAVSVLVSYR